MTIQELAKQVYEDFKLGENEDFLYQVKTKTEFEFAALAHFGLGLSIRNRYGLWDEYSKYYEKNTDGMSIHPDDVSHEVLLEVYRYAKRMLDN